MKANEAPEKIYFEVNNNLIGLYDSAILKMFSVKKNKTVIEYTRTDAFIEKACDWLDDLVLSDYVDIKETSNGTFVTFDQDKLVKDFRKYMKGE